MIKIGTSGFSFPSWKGNVYPPHLKSRDMLIYYQDYLGFDMVELDYTFYSMPERSTMAVLVDKTHPHFLFVVKANRLLTHDIRDPWTRRIRDNDSLFDQFLFAIEPMRQRGKLGCILFQFPPEFGFSGENLSYLLVCKEHAGEIPIAVEFRSESWNREKTFAFLHDHNIAFCAADQTAATGIMPFINRTTSIDTAFFRFHGRDGSWIDGKTGLRNIFLYSHFDLFSFREKIMPVARKTGMTYICFNNCHAGASAKNARQMKKLLGIPDAGIGGSFDLFD